MSPTARAAELVRDHGLKPDDFVVHVGSGGAELLTELHRLGCRVLALDPTGAAGNFGIDTLRTILTPPASRLVRERYGAVRLLIATTDVPLAAASACLASGGAVVLTGDTSTAHSPARAA